MNIKIRGLEKTYPGHVHALTDVNLDIDGVLLGLLGANGAGKTTLMRILAGIIRPTRGSVRIREHDIANASGRTAVKRTLGYLPQELGLYPELTAREFLDYIAVLKGITNRHTRANRVPKMLQLVGLDSAASRKLKTLSGGMKRRVGITQALLNDPQLLIVDEPTAGLDPEERIRFRTLLTGLAGDRTVLLSTHIVEDIAQTSRNVAALANGQLIYHGQTGGLAAIAHDQVWTLTTPGPPPDGEQTIVSALPVADGVQYRVIGEHQNTAGAQKAQPTLEDGYVALIRQRRDNPERVSAHA